MKKAIVITLGVIIGVTGVLAICAHLADAAKLALYLSGSYSNKLEQLVSVSETTPEGKPKTAVDLLVERINKIQEEIKEQNQMLPEDEQAFLDAAEEQYDMRPMTRLTGGRMFGR